MDTITLLLGASSLALGVIAVPFGMYGLASYDIFFKFQEEGTASALMRGETLYDIVASWKGRILNRPGHAGYNPALPDYEVMLTHPDDPEPDVYNFPLWNWMAKKFGIYYIGLWPFVQVHWYKFEWVEGRVNATGEMEDWKREELSDFIYINAFTYHFCLRAAEDTTNRPIDLEFALTVVCNNPQKALFEIVDWLKRLTVDALAIAREYVGGSSFEELRSQVGRTSTSFVDAMQSLNDTLPSQGGATTLGAKDLYGISIVGADILQVALAGSNSVELAKASQAKGIAQQLADAKVITADGNARARVVEAEGNAKAAKLEGDGQAAAIEATYTAISKHPQGAAIRNAEALERAAKNGATIFFGNNNAVPLINVGAPNNTNQPNPGGGQTPPASPPPTT